ncbi:MAG: IS66 family transposase [Candidatus Colwellbacteria bacterium]|nr:IS66 family transposase [Candidatus Colwellbacteria bacterium]
MLGIGLSPDEVTKRLVRLNNLERLHATQKKRVGLLEEQVRLFKKENELLRKENRMLHATIDDLKLQMEELRMIVFGKKHKKTGKHDNDFPTAPLFSREPRPKESYRRNLPSEDEVTGTESHSIDYCAYCGGAFIERDSKTYFEEDIPLPQKKIILKHIIEKGYCERCRYWSEGAPIPTASVILGQNVKRYISYLSVVCRESYSQIEEILKQTCDFDISQGEISNILEKEGNRLRPDYERLKAKIRGEPSIHLDETGWDILMNQGERGFAWTMVGGVSKDAVFTLGKNRGKGNAEKLIGDSKAVRVTDDYAVYRNLKGEHQLCCAHILRKLRDLAGSDTLTEQSRLHGVRSYETFAVIYADIETARMSSDPMRMRDALHERLKQFAAPDRRDPLKLARVKTQVRGRSEKYLTCLQHSNVASDNNAAERSLRHLVLKRKISFGSFSERTAETMAILLSMLLSYKNHGTLRNYLMGV